MVNNLADVFYLCVIMMAYGPPFVKATIYGIILNMVQSLALLPEVMANGKHVCTYMHWHGYKHLEALPTALSGL